MAPSSPRADAPDRSASHERTVLAGTTDVETLTLEGRGLQDGSGPWRWTYKAWQGKRLAC